MKLYTCVGRRTAHHQEPKPALAASDFSYVEGCWTCSWWTFFQAQCAWQRPPTTRPKTFHIWKTRGCQCSFRLLVMGGVSPETCWASYKYGIIKFWYIVASFWTCSWWTLSGTLCLSPPTARPTTFHVWKTRGCKCSFRLLMMGGVSSETCSASCKYGIIKFWYIVASCWIILYEFYYDVRTYEHQLCNIYGFSTAT